MQNIIKTLTSGFKTWTQGLVKDSVADWNQNDKNANNYVKNRPFWKEDDKRVYILNPQNLSFSSAPDEFPYNEKDYSAIYSCTLTDFSYSRHEIFTSTYYLPYGFGKNYIVEWDGITYNCGTQNYDLLVIGNASLFASAYENTGEPFAIVLDVYGDWALPEYMYIMTTDNAAVHDINISYIEEGEVKIDFLPTVGKFTNRLKTAEKFNDYKNNIASGSYSHAEGQGTKASGQTSHAEGAYTTASGQTSHAEGQNTTASNAASHAEGWSTTASGGYSHAEGWSTTASGSYSHAEGWSTTASGYVSHAEGDETKASGGRSHAEGFNTKATSSNDTAITTSTIDKGYCTHAEGYGTIAYGAVSHAEGNGTKASGSYSHSEGYGTIASGERSHAEGQITTASGKYSHAEGVGATASGEGSHAEGFNTKATSSNDAILTTSITNKGYYTHAEGYGTVAYGAISHAEGNGTKASGQTSHAEGYNTTASGTYSHAEGQSTKASGQTSHAEGQNTTASGYYSHAEGSGTVASGDHSHAEGLFTTASSAWQHAQGKYNIGDAASVYSHIVGNGTSTSECSNAHTLDWSGNAWYAGDVYVGSTSGTNKDEGSKKLATEEYVTQKVAEINAEYDAIILKSSTSGSTKKFQITIGDDGVLSAEEVVL